MSENTNPITPDTQKEADEIVSKNMLEGRYSSQYITVRISLLSKSIATALQSAKGSAGQEVVRLREALDDMVRWSRPATGMSSAEGHNLALTKAKNLLSASATQPPKEATGKDCLQVQMKGAEEAPTRMKGNGSIVLEAQDKPNLGDDLEKVARRICAQFQLVGDWPWEYVYTELKDAILAAKGE